MIKYFTKSINWYSFNTIIIGMPITLLILSYVNPRNEQSDAKDGSYWHLMVILAVAHCVQFIFIRQLMKVQTREQIIKSGNTSLDDDSFQKVQDNTNTSGNLVEKKFNYDYWWFWIISFIAEITVLVLYFCTDGNELYFIFWIPTDAILFSCMFLYYIKNMYQDKKRLENERAMQR